MSRPNEAQREYKRNWMRRWRERERLAHLPQKLLAKGKCPICEMFLVAEWHIEFQQDHIQKIMLMVQGIHSTEKVPIPDSLSRIPVNG